MQANRLLLCLLLFSFSPLLLAQSLHLRGNMEDLLLNKPLKGATVSLHQTDSTIIGEAVLSVTRYILVKDKLVEEAHYQIPIEAKCATYLIHARKQGFYDIWQEITVSDADIKKNYVRVPILKMRNKNPEWANARKIILSGNVEDAFLNKPLAGVKVEVTNLDSSLVAPPVTVASRYSSSTNGQMITQSEAFEVSFDADRTDYLVHAFKEGYGDVWQKVSLADIARNNIQIPTLKMRRSMDRQLGEATVTATRVKMYWKGDTLVYDAAAFKLPEGSMLDELIAQLPGVTMNNDGEIFVNGKKVEELLLGSRSFMRGNQKILLENLPYYTVKDIKVYDQRSEKSEALGYDVGGKKYVMDVQLKPEYNRGYITNMEAGYGTEERWLGRAFGLFFTDNLRVTLVGNANNVSESRHIGQVGFWQPGSPPNALKLTRSAKGEVAYFRSDNKLKNTLTAEYTSTTEDQQQRERKELYLQGKTPTSTHESHNRTSNRIVEVQNSLTLLKPFYLKTYARFNHTTNDVRSGSIFYQWNDQFTDNLTTSNQNTSFREGTNWTTRFDASSAFNVGKNQKHIDLSATVEYRESSSMSANRYVTRQFAVPSLSTRHNANDYNNRIAWGWFTAKYGMKLTRLLHVEFKDEISFINNHTHDYLYHPDTLLLPSQLKALQAITDFNNSYSQHDKVLENTLNALFIRKKITGTNADGTDKSYERWRLGFAIPVKHQSLDYKRGRIDTLISDNSIFFRPNFMYNLQWKNGRSQLSFDAAHDRQAVGLHYKIDYRDDSSPLVVRLNNPALKGSMNSRFGGRYHFYNNLYSIGADANFKYEHRNIAQSTTYNPSTGVYTYKPMNVSGGYDGSVSCSYDRRYLLRPLSWNVKAGARYHNSVDHTMFEGDSESHKNSVGTLTLNSNAQIKYSKKDFEANAYGNLSWRRSEGRMRDFATLNAFDYNYGLKAYYRIPRIKTTLRADFTMYSRRGYGSASLNTDDFIMNASISQPLLKNRLTVRVEAYDILHQLSSTKYEVNAQGRTETWYRTLPNYIMFHLVWQWSKTPQKQ